MIAISAGTLPVSVTPASSGVVQAGFIAANGASAGYAGTPSSTPRTRGPFSPAVSSRGVTPPPSSAVSAANTPAIARALAPSIAPAVMTPPVPTGLPGISRSAPSRTPVMPATPAMAPAAMPAAMPAALPTGTPAAAPTPAAGRRPINPFLNADPGQRARRLARALVSDLVAYHPQKREEGLRDGTLRQLFREEIKKSYEEFVEQVGRELADGSPHFQDALNDILGGGRKLF
ncbi:MAG: hypothetical protein V4617_15530 [Gemmatimonadota bacterium]